MNETTDTPIPRPPLWRLILDCAKNIAFFGGCLAACVAASAGIIWCVPYIWAFWVVIAQSVTLGGSPWAVLVASVASLVLMLLGLCVTDKLGSDDYQGEPSRRDWSVVISIIVAGILCLAVALTASLSGQYISFSESEGPISTTVGVVTFLACGFDMLILAFLVRAGLDSLE